MQISVTLTPELRRLALAHVREVEQGDDLENLTRWFQEQETPDGYTLDAFVPEECHMIVVIARALLWAHHDREDVDR